MNFSYSSLTIHCNLPAARCREGNNEGASPKVSRNSTSASNTVLEILMSLYFKFYIALLHK